MENNRNDIEHLLRNSQQSAANYPRQSSGIGVLIALICGCLVIGLLLGTPIGYLVSAPFYEDTVYLEPDDYDYEASYYTSLINNMESAIRYYDMPELEIGAAYKVPFNYAGEPVVITIDSLTTGKADFYGDEEDALSITLTIDNMTSDEVYASLNSIIEIVDQDGNLISSDYSGDTVYGDIMAGDSIVLDDIYELSGVTEITVRLYGYSSIPSAEATFKVSDLKKTNAVSL
ncbi:hypothetical protein [Culicoidibacter larvae]|uniref:Uncharacterized protein n=1 Tax=Culicoidibacter larvae TaxID=2579976 RepID=A0A5R8QD05_9FIRM|nr:hypothetical protein [Culicoidibacter larvae]TLG72982.1 hypothetical protein FEZ08_08020 [Culicoidibacter larvae]